MDNSYHRVILLSVFLFPFLPAINTLTSDTIMNFVFYFFKAVELIIR